MSNHCYTTIYLVGSNAAVAKAECGLKEIYCGIWEELEADGKVHVPRKKSPSFQLREYPPAFRYGLWYPWGPPSEELDKLAADNPDVILAIMFDEVGIGFRGQRFYVDGVVQAWHHGSYGPDGHEFYDDISPLPDFSTSLDYYIYNFPWRGREAAFAEAEPASMK